MSGNFILKLCHNFSKLITKIQWSIYIYYRNSFHSNKIDKIYVNRLVLKFKIEIYKDRVSKRNHRYLTIEPQNVVRASFELQSHLALPYHIRIPWNGSFALNLIYIRAVYSSLHSILSARTRCSYHIRTVSRRRRY